MILRIIKNILIFLTALLIIALLVLFVPPLYRRNITYPRATRELEELQKRRQVPDKMTDLRLFRGVMHAHTFWSHDSRGSLADIVPAAKLDNIDFIFLTDHPKGNTDTLPRGYHGLYDNVLIVPGSEKQGFDAWPLKPAIIDWTRNRDTIAGNITANGGMIFYAHPEEEHNWGNPWFQGMEIYNFHADTKDENIIFQLANFIVNGSRYPQLSFREMFDEQTAIMARWDSLNTYRKIVGIAAEDTHENQNIRARFLSDGRIQWVGPDAHIIDTTRVAFWNRWMLHPPDKSGWIFKWMVDTYREGFRYITNYVLADTLTVSSLSRHILKGHLYTAFMSLGDAGGFMFSSTGTDGRQCGIMGDSVSFENVRSFSAVSPLPGQFRLLHNGTVVNASSYDTYRYQWDEMIEKGAYRIEVHIKPGKKDLPWIYSNPIYVY